MVGRKKKLCCECERPLIKNEVALSQKLLGRNIENFYCINCMAEYLECPAEDLRVKIQEFKEQGCTLFL
jgi:hypothetical protein